MAENILGDEMVSAQDHQRAVTEAKAEGRREATASATTAVQTAVDAERERIRAAIAHEGVKGNELYALKMALKFPTASAGDIAEMVQDAPKPAATAAAVRSLAERTAATGVNDVGAGTGQSDTTQHSDGQPKVDWAAATKAAVHPSRLRS